MRASKGERRLWGRRAYSPCCRMRRRMTTQRRLRCSQGPCGRSGRALFESRSFSGFTTLRDALYTLLYGKFLLNVEFLDALAKGCSGDPEKLCGLDLVAVGLDECPNDQFAFDCRKDFELWIIPCPMKKESREGNQIPWLGIVAWFACFRTAGVCLCLRTGTTFLENASLGGEPLRMGIVEQLRWKVGGKDGVALCNHECTANDVLKFADVSGPMVLLQEPKRFAGNRSRGFTGKFA